MKRRLALGVLVLALGACGGNGDGDDRLDPDVTQPPTGPAPTGTIGDTTEDEPSETRTNEDEDDD